jgi:amino acid transporter
MSTLPSQPSPPVDPDEGWVGRASRTLFGAPRDVQDPGVFHKISLIAFLAWIGLGADGLSSSAYGPPEAFKNLQGQWYLSVVLALATAFTVFVISYGYTRVIEHFPHGGGGYVVATKLLGKQAGVVSGCALLVDYVLTITTSVAAGGDAIFNLLPDRWSGNINLKVGCEVGVLVLLIIMNLRGVKESVKAVMPIFLIFVATHLILIVGGIGANASRLPTVAHEVTSGFRNGLSTIGGWGLFMIAIRAFSLGGGTFTGIEAVSNGIPIMREPRVQTGKKTMVYMAASLAFTAGGIMLCYLLFDVKSFFQLPEAEQLKKTLNWVLANNFAGHWHLGPVPIGSIFVSITIASEAALLFVAAQTGFIDGPRVMSNMAIDSWLPHRFASLSDRLTSKDGVLLMGISAIIILVAMHGSVDALVVMYAINVFVTFSLTNLGMCRFWVGERKKPKSGWLRHMSVHAMGLALCLAILTVTIMEKFSQGAWLTIVITCATIAVCLWVRYHYRSVALKLRQLDHEFLHLPTGTDHGGKDPDPKLPTAVLLVGQYGGVGIHSLLSIQKMIPNYFKNVIFVSVAVIDSGHFKGPEEIDALKTEVDDSLKRYVALARRLGWNAGSATGVGTDPVDAIYRACMATAKTFHQVMFFGGKLIWKRESWWQRLMHNETAFQVQRRLQWKGQPMTIIPLRVIKGKEVPQPSSA